MFVAIKNACGSRIQETSKEQEPLEQLEGATSAAIIES